jgi:uncharacterized protein DUF4012
MAREMLLRPPRERRRPVLRRKALIVSTLLMIALLGVIAMATVATALSIRRHFEDGRRLLVTAQSALLAGKADRAAADFESARQAFLRAQGEPGNVLLRVEGALPFVGRTPDALVSLSRIGAQVAEGGADVARGVERLPHGLSSLGLVDGRIQLDSLRSLAPYVRRARASLDSAARVTTRLPNSWVIGRVAEARDLVRERLARALPLVRSADALLSSLPRFAGQGRAARYFVAAQNSSELRGTGGLLGNYAILTIREGHISIGRFKDISDLPDLPAAKAPSPSKDFDDLYGPFGGGGFWPNINMTPDAPTAATLIEQMYQRVADQRLDGTIFFDLQGLTDLLRATGPVQSKRLGYTFTAQNVVKYVATAAYLRAPVPRPFSEGPRLVAETVWNRFLSGTDSEKALRALVTAAAKGHLVLHGVDPQVQAAFRLAGVAGDFGGGDTDFFGVAHSNAAANKVDFYLRQELSYQVRLQPNGRAEAVASTTIINRAPVGARPGYVFGPSSKVIINGRHLEPGEDRTWTQFYCAQGCRLARALVEREDTILESHRELGLPVYAGFFEVKPSRSRKVDLSLQLPSAWEGDRTVGSYRLRVQAQPSLATAGTVTIRAPDGMRIVWTSVPMQVESGMATWRGSLEGARDFEVRFQRSWFSRIRTRVWSFLSKPVIHL